MTTINRRHLGGIILAASGMVLTGCSGIAATIETDAEKISATISTDVPTLTTLYGIAKGIGQVALAALEVSDPAAASIITEGITLVDGWITAGTATVATNAATVISTTNAILAAAAPAVTAVANAA